MKHFQDLLKSSDVDLRIVAGETIAMLFDLSQCDSHAVYIYWNNYSKFFIEQILIFEF